jgi:hypothetical protein
MSDRFLEVCAREFATHAKLMFDTAPRIPGTGMAEIPVIGGPFLLGMEVPPVLYERVCMAMGARERFDREAPGWPTLPLHEKDIESLKNDDTPRLAVVGYYADSLAAVYWDYLLHPRLDAFCAGLLACEYAPDNIRNDPALLQEFPPRELEGLCDGQLYWRSPAAIAFDREMQARCAAWEARRAAGRTV